MSKNLGLFITGSTGFIGQNLVGLCSKLGIEMSCWKRESTTGHYQLDQSLFKSTDSIVHLAARVHQMRETSSDPLTAYRILNCDLTIKLAEAGLKAGLKKFIFISSVKAMEGYGRKSETGTDEISNLEIQDPYGRSKWEAEQRLVELFSKQSETQCIILRLPMVYGPGNKGNMLPLLKSASKGISLPLAAAKGKRSIVYVKNVCDAIVRVLQDDQLNRPSIQIYCLTDTNDLTSGELYSLISQSYSGKSQIFWLPEKLFRWSGQIGSILENTFKAQLPINQRVISRLFDEYRFSSQQFCQDYDWHPPYTSEQGILETVQWYKTQ